ncbi:MAG: cytochrome c family protein [Planctomycetes bacterium]|nr:cytochrome c family protein [Planctomycetota bacterium]
MRTVLDRSESPTPFRPGASAAVETDPMALREAREANPRFFNYGGIVFWWDAFPEPLREAAIATGPQSNMHRTDYAGPDSCRECHQENYEQWSRHPHRHMNALATAETVAGDFSGEQTIHYLGGEASFYREADGFRMKLERDETRIVYEVRQTIGSRFFQYYVGRLIEGPFAADHAYRTTNHVLPFGYWLDRRQWVPVVHLGSEKPDGERDDPFAPPPHPREGENFTPYASNCSTCHTTFPLGDDLTRKPHQLAAHTPFRLHWNMADYFREAHPELWGDLEHPADLPTPEIDRLPQTLMEYEAEEHAVTLGVSCEACHLGCQQHARNPRRRPKFHPHSPHLLVQTNSGELEEGRTHQNLNWACARCHVGDRPRFAAGMSTWNSVEYSDAMLGSCYSQLKCIDCHAPHQATGPTWPRSPLEDDASCTRCHTQYQSADAIARHTHHPVDSSGSRCMNCHMPRINEGLQDVVRTHTIFSPTNAAMMEANHPNACNLCHADQPIDWTLEHLREWYDATFSEEAIATAYPHRDDPAAAGWMKSDYEPVRLVGADAACRAGSRELLPELIEMLDDPFLLNRQFTARGLEKMLDIRLDDYGYRFYMSPQERAGPLRLLRSKLLGSAGQPAP